MLQDALEALKEISEFYTENTLECRRGLRTKIEKRSLALNEVSLFVQYFYYIIMLDITILGPMRGYAWFDQSWIFCASPCNTLPQRNRF